MQAGVLAWFDRLLVANPILAFFLIVAAGYGLGAIPLGRAKVRLGLAPVLFVGLAFGAVEPRLQFPEFAGTLGLTLFMYSVGLGSSAGFFNSLNRGGLPLLAVTAIPLALGGAAAWGAAELLGLARGAGGALFAGSMSSSSGLASLVDSVRNDGGASAVPTVTYSLTYLASIVMPMAAIWLAPRLFRTSYAADADRYPELRRASAELVTATLRVVGPPDPRRTVGRLSKVDGRAATVFGRIERDGKPLVADNDLELRAGDVAVVVGAAEDLDALIAGLGERITEEPDPDPSEFELRRVFVSNPGIVGRPLEALRLPDRMGLKVTRVRRGDAEFVPDGNTRLELGDRLRLLGQAGDVRRVRAFFGDSYAALGEVNFLALGAGMAAGVVLGLARVPLPGGLSFRLGLSGGTLAAGLVFGRWGRLGPLVWSVPSAASLTLRQFGLILFAAGLGVQAGPSFVALVRAPIGAATLLAGFGVSAAVGLATLLLGRAVLGMPLAKLVGVYAGQQTQPFALGFAADRVGSDVPASGYAAAFPAATLLKIVLTQAVYYLLR